MRGRAGDAGEANKIRGAARVVAGAAACACAARVE